jgi:hypothetical protein
METFNEGKEEVEEEDEYDLPDLSDYIIPFDVVSLYPRIIPFYNKTKDLINILYGRRIITSIPT